MKILVLIIALSCWFFLANGRQKVLQSNGCDNILSRQVCAFFKELGECYKGYAVPRYCRWTCGFCSVHFSPCKVTALGMQSRAIPDSRITASSNYNSNHAAKQGRLHYRPNGRRTGAWSARQNRVGQWLQVDLGKVMKVLGVATQGRYDHNQWVQSYSLQYSNNGRTFKIYQGGRVFSGNKDRNSVVKHIVYPPIVARFVRVVVKTWYGHISMRMELYGCKI